MYRGVLSVLNMRTRKKEAKQDIEKCKKKGRKKKKKFVRDNSAFCLACGIFYTYPKKTREKEEITERDL